MSDDYPKEDLPQDEEVIEHGDDLQELFITNVPAQPKEEKPKAPGSINS